MNRRVNTYSNRGFTLVETLPALTLGSIQIAAASKASGRATPKAVVLPEPEARGS